MHEDLKLRFNGRVVFDKLTGERKTIGGSTKVLSTIQFEEYMERIRIEYATVHGFMLLLPNEKLQEA